MDRTGTTLKVLATVAAVSIALATAGCWNRIETVAPSADTPAATETIATVVTTATPDTTPPPPPPPVDATIKSGPDLGPNETGTHFAYLKSMHEKDGYVYAVVDYILIGEGGDGWFITNDNPKLRTFPLAKSCPCRYLKQGTSDLSLPLTPSAFMAQWAAAPSAKMIRRNPYVLTVNKGTITKFDNEWLP